MSNLWLEYSIFCPWGTLKISWNSSLGYYLQVGNDILFYTIFASSNLSGNKFNGSVPEALIQKSRDGSLILRLVFHVIYFIFLYFLVVLISSSPFPPSYCFLNMQNQYRGFMFICIVNLISFVCVSIYIYIYIYIYILCQSHLSFK